MIKLFPHKRTIWAQDFDGDEDFGRWCYKGGGSAPPPPDPVATAKAQSAINKETAIAQNRLNQYNEYNPLGSSVYTQRLDEGGNPIEIDGITQFDRTVTYNPEDQAQLDREREIRKSLTQTGDDQLARIDRNLSQEFNYEGIPELLNVSDDAARRRIEDVLYNSYASRLDPRFNQEQQRLETQLANQGIQRGTDAWLRESGNFARNKNDAYQQALADSVAAGGQEMARQYGLSQSARQQGITERLSQRNQPLNELATLLGTSPSVGTPQFAPAPTSGVASPDLMGATYQSYRGNLAAHNAAQQAGAARSGAMAGLAGSALIGGAMFF